MARLPPPRQATAEPPTSRPWPTRRPTRYSADRGGCGHPGCHQLRLHSHQWHPDHQQGAADGDGGRQDAALWRSQPNPDQRGNRIRQWRDCGHCGRLRWNRQRHDVGHATTNAGTAPIAAAAGTLAATNYDFTATNGTLTINKAHLTVTADDKTRLYGAANPTLTSAVTGFVTARLPALRQATVEPPASRPWPTRRPTWVRCDRGGCGQFGRHQLRLHHADQRHADHQQGQPDSDGRRQDAALWRQGIPS